MQAPMKQKPVILTWINRAGVNHYNLALDLGA